MISLTRDREYGATQRMILWVSEVSVHWQGLQVNLKCWRSAANSVPALDQGRYMELEMKGSKDRRLAVFDCWSSEGHFWRCTRIERGSGLDGVSWWCTVRTAWDVGVRRRRGVGHSKEQTRKLIEEASSEPVRLGKMSEAISPHEKGQ